MKRRGFLGFLGGLPFATKALAEPRPPAPPPNIGEGSIKEAPAISFTNDAETGLYRIGAESIGMSVRR